MTLQTTTTTVIYKWDEEQKLESNGIVLSQALSKDTRWAKAVVCGPDSIIEPGDKLLMSARPTVSYFEVNGENLMNTSDASIMSYKRDGKLGCTKGTFLYSYIETPEEITESGIIVVKKTTTKEFEPIKVLVEAAGPDSGVQAGDVVLLLYKNDCYKLNIDGKELQNAGAEEVICLWRD